MTLKQLCLLENEEHMILPQTTGLVFGDKTSIGVLL